jgi:hypothetical protein
MEVRRTAHPCPCMCAELALCIPCHLSQHFRALKHKFPTRLFKTLDELLQESHSDASRCWKPSVSRTPTSETMPDTWTMPRPPRSAASSSGNGTGNSTPSGTPSQVSETGMRPPHGGACEFQRSPPGEMRRSSERTRRGCRISSRSCPLSLPACFWSRDALVAEIKKRA